MINQIADQKCNGDGKSDEHAGAMSCKIALFDEHIACGKGNGADCVECGINRRQDVLVVVIIPVSGVFVLH